jgi:hypothetical protein
MSAQVTLTLPDKVYERVRDFAQTRKQEIAAAITNLLEDSLPLSESQKPTNADQSKEFEALDREEEAYIKLHAQLKKSHFGRYVAIYQGKLIDDAADFGTLVERVRNQLPHEVVWMSQVENEPIPTIVLRSPRFIHE